MISAIGRWVVEEACRILAGWQRHGVTVPLSINISAVQLRDASIVSHLHALLERHRIAPGSGSIAPRARVSSPRGGRARCPSRAQTPSDAYESVCAGLKALAAAGLVDDAQAARLKLTGHCRKQLASLLLCLLQRRRMPLSLADARR